MRQIVVPVLSKDGKPLMPCSSNIARLLLDSGMARVKKKEPFIIQLNYETNEKIKPHTLAIDTGAGKAGFAVINSNGEIVYMSVVILRNDIKNKMDQRRRYRHSRRSRNTRCRPVRSNNRKTSTRKDRFSPTMVSKLHSHIKEIKFLKSIFPIDDRHIIFEVGLFDPAAMNDPRLRYSKVKPWGYQKGLNCGFENTKAKVRFRDNNTCQICGGKSKDRRLDVHHIIFKSNFGSDHEDNLITLCKTCHEKLHSGLITTNLAGKIRGNLNFATQMNMIRSQLTKMYPNAKVSWGYITATNRKSLGYSKSTHWLDAVIIATAGKQPIFKTNQIYIKRCVAKGDYKQTSGRSSERKLNRGKIMGFRKYDKVIYSNRLCFIMSCRSNGKPELMDIYGNKISFSYLPWGKKSPKFKEMKRISARSSQIVWTQHANINLLV